MSTTATLPLAVGDTSGPSTRRRRVGMGTGAVAPVTPKEERAQPAKRPETTLCVGGAVGVAVLLGAVLLLLPAKASKPKDQTAKAPVEKPAVAAKAAHAAPPPAVPVAEARPTQAANPESARPPQEATALGLPGAALAAPAPVLPPAPALEAPPQPTQSVTPPPPTPAPVAPAPPAEPDWTTLTDPKALRELLLSHGKKPPHEQLRRLAALPVPEQPERVLYRAPFAQLQLDDWRKDYDSKLSLVTEEGEKALKVEGVGERAVCYHTFSFVAGNNRLKLRLYQSGIQTMKVSVKMTVDLRYNVTFDAPRAKQWTDVTVDLSKAVEDGCRFAHLPVQHLEIHGLRAKGATPRFLLSGFELLEGGGP